MRTIVPAPEEVALAFGRAIRRARGPRTQRWLANRAGVDQATVSRIERGRYRLTVELMVTIAAALDTHPADLYEFPAAESSAVFRGADRG
jgi:DNA-binding XRE family transcriptional regulator